MATTAIAPLDRFLTKVIKVPSGCWEWTAAKNNSGYGVFGVAHHRVINAHRWAYENFVGKIPSAHEIHHLCENKTCVNPEHLTVVRPDEHPNRAFRPGRKPKGAPGWVIRVKRIAKEHGLSLAEALDIRDADMRRRREQRRLDKSNMLR